MSFSGQEQVVFELLFNQDLLDEYTEDPRNALSLYGLTKQEVDDFLPLRLDALKLEADIRKRMILSQITIQLPLTIALISSFDNGFSLLKRLLLPFIVKENAEQRAVLLADQLAFSLDELVFFNEQDKVFIETVILLEKTMAKQLVSFKTDKRRHNDNGYVKKCSEQLQHDKPLILEEHASVHLLPLSYWQLKEELCSVAPNALWRELQNNPLLVEQRVSLFSSISESTTKCLVTLPRLLINSPTDSVVDLNIIEMIDGFIPLLDKINGHRSLSVILESFEKVGASKAVIKQAQQGFQTLFDQQCLTYA